jgi:hypothetical protein
MFRSLSYDHHQGSITVLVQILLIGVHTSSYSGLWLYVVRVSVRTMYLSLWCLVMYCRLYPDDDARFRIVFTFIFVNTVGIPRMYAAFSH